MSTRTRVDALLPAKVPDGRISPRLEQALGLMVHRGLSIREAAQSTGYAPNSLAVALRKAHVQARHRELRLLALENGRDLAIKTLLDLAANSKSEDIRLRAARALVDVSERLDGGLQEPAQRGGVLIQIVESHRARAANGPPEPA